MDILTGGKGTLTLKLIGLFLVVVVNSHECEASHSLESIRDWDPEEHGLGPVCTVLMGDKSSHSTSQDAMATSSAMECMRIQKGRSCMGISETAPMHVGRNCSGSQCLLSLYPENSPCMLEAYGVDVQIKNASRKATCGLNAEDSHWLYPRDSNLQGSSATSIGQQIEVNHGSETWDLHDLPPGVSMESWCPCQDGVPSEVIHLKFPKSLGSSFTCVGSPACLCRKFSFHFMCYSTDCREDEMDNVRKNDARFNLPGLGMVGVAILITRFILLKA